ncbi:hypothetical protein [Zhihengliuella sp.]|uniref:hypothetical protein n=1 Tax=Zhihengliuella sp. TaxID=1954483 RepID=UPI0028111908|nr:hypothetical protein [Zhihengliuella sp.]
MALDTSGLQGWPDPATIKTDAGQLPKKGQEIHEVVGDCATEWAAVDGAYREGPGRDAVVQAMTMPLAHATAVEVVAEQAKGHLETYAETVTELKTRKTNLESRISTFNSNASSSDPDVENPEFGYGSQAEIQGKINDLVADLTAAADTCAKDINGIDVTDDGFVDLLTEKEAGLAVEVLGEGLSLTMFQDVRFSQLTIVQTTYQRWKLTAITVPSRVIVTPSGRYIATVTLVQETLETMTVTDVTRRTWTQRQFLDMRPEVNEFLFRNSAKYRSYVEANPGRWQPFHPGSRPAWWRADQKLVNFADDFRASNGWTKFVRGAGPVVSVVMAGLTYRDEYEDAKAKLLEEHPDWSESEIHNRALYESATRGTTKVVLDLGAGMTGMAIGTAIGGPLGAVVGFGVGVGLSYLMDATGFKDWAAEGVTDLVDGAGELLDDAGDAVSDAWNSIF